MNSTSSQDYVPLGDEQLDREHRELLDQILEIDRLIGDEFDPEDMRSRIKNVITLFRDHIPYEEKIMESFEHGPALLHKVTHNSHHETFLIGLEFLLDSVEGRHNRTFLTKVSREKVNRVFLELMEYDQEMMRLHHGSGSLEIGNPAAPKQA
ncbi:protein of unknown function [Magnetospira sp. QH-2]|nr:protein of unknown function [Magnetospira sp. QH-2]